MVQFIERDAVAFQIIDSQDGDSARGHWTGNITGVVRPFLQWDTEYTPNGYHGNLPLERKQGTIG